MKNWLSVLLLLYAALLAGCALSESDEAIRQKLELILQDDMAVVLAEIDSSALADTTHYTVEEYAKYDEGKYAVKAVVDFHLFKTVKVKMVRKYRYHGQVKKWERYFNEYQMINETSAQ